MADVTKRALLWSAALPAKGGQDLHVLSPGISAEWMLVVGDEKLLLNII
jgi:hypothetical protein